MVVLLVVPGLFLCSTQTFLSYNSGIRLETKLQSKNIEESSLCCIMLLTSCLIAIRLHT